MNNLSQEQNDFNGFKYYSSNKTGYQHLNKEELENLPKHALDENLFVRSFAHGDLCKLNNYDDDVILA